MLTHQSNGDGGRVENMLYMTSGLRGMLEQARIALERGEITPDQHHRHVLDAHRIIRRYRDEILNTEAGVMRAVILHRAVDEAILENRKAAGGGWTAVTCGAGCAGCCHMAPTITSDEALLLATLIAAGEVSVDVALLREQAKFSGSGNDWWNQEVEKKRCVFLNKENLCSVYKDRPMTCRKYYVVTEPMICHASRVTTGVGVFSIATVELLVSAALDVDRKKSFGKTFSQMILDFLKNPKHIA